MSFSAARPIVMAPGVPAADDERGESNFTKRVARFDTSAVLASTTVSSVGGVKPGWGGDSGVHDGPLVGWCAAVRDARCRHGPVRGRRRCLTGRRNRLPGRGIRRTAGRLGGTGRDGAALGPPRAGFLTWPGRGGGGGCVGFVCSGSADQASVGGPASGVGRVLPGRSV